VFERVRRKMAELIQTGIAGLEPDGSISLDKAFEAACALDKDVAEQMIAQRIAADRKAASDAAARARRGAASLLPSSPGRNTGSSGNAKKQSRSVRESIESAIEEARGGLRI
jgi:hypothetical protein